MLIKRFNEEGATESQIAGMKVRNAVRVVILNTEFEIALIHVTKKKFYSHPGGGVEKGEELIAAAIRECKEETGCEIDILEELGVVEEIILTENLINRSTGYIARVTGETQTTELAPDEQDDGFQVEWFSFDDALKLLRGYNSDTPLNFRYFFEREISFVEEAKLTV